jgi:agmatinase
MALGQREYMIPAKRTFCDVPSWDGSRGADVVIFGAANGTLYQPGTASHAAKSPAAVRQALDWFSVGREQFDFDCAQPLMGAAQVADYGDVETDAADSAANRRGIKAAAGRILGSGSIPVVLGGDDSVPIPVFEAYAEHGPPLTIVQVDAHIDWRDEIWGERFGYSSTMRRASEMSHIASLIQIGARGPGSARRSDVEDARTWGAKLFTARDVHRHGIGPAIAAIEPGSEVFLSIDVDGLDPALMPGVILPAFGGVSYQQMLDLFEGVAAKARLAGAAFVEYVPERDPTSIGAKAIGRLACCLIAHAFPHASAKHPNRR